MTILLLIAAASANAKLDPAFWVLPVHDDPIERDCEIDMSTPDTPDFDMNAF